MKKAAFRASKISDLSAQKNEADSIRQKAMLKDVMAFEGVLTNVAVGQEELHVREFKKHAAEVLLNVLTNVYQEILASTIKAETRSYFRTIRMAMITKRAKAMCSRKKLVNWIRICQRLNGLANNAHIYRSKRIQWGIFNRWLKLLELELLDCTAGLIDIIIMKRKKYEKLSKYLIGSGIKKVVCFFSPGFLYAMSTTEGRIGCYGIPRFRKFMYICIYIYIYIYVYMYIFTYMYISIHKYMYIFIYVFDVRYVTLFYLYIHMIYLYMCIYKYILDTYFYYPHILILKINFFTF
jgi:hypothetical protein